MPQRRLAPGERDLAASLGKLLQARGYSVTIQKFDPYINIDPGTISPSEEEGALLQYLSLESKYKKDKEGTIAALENYVRAYPKGRDAGKAELLLARAATRRRSAAPRPQPATPSSPSLPAPSTYASPPRSAMSSTSSGASTGLPLLAAEG
nr:hypothetical protein [uncultured Porphyromonas sp.]